jgi:hypothetical protein
MDATFRCNLHFDESCISNPALLESSPVSRSDNSHRFVHQMWAISLSIFKQLLISRGRRRFRFLGITPNVPCDCTCGVDVVFFVCGMHAWPAAVSMKLSLLSALQHFCLPLHHLSHSIVRFMVTITMIEVPRLVISKLPS